jgi:hypothetical protein
MGGRPASRIRASARIASVVVLLMWPAAADAQLILDEPVLSPVSVSGFGGYLAWSRLDAERGRFELMAAHEGVVETLPVRPRATVFDVDLGPGPDGNTVAVYSRCREEVPYRGSGGPAGLPAYETGKGCALFEYDFARRVERRLRGLGLPRGSSAYEPTVWRSRIAFAFRRADRLTAPPEVRIGHVGGATRAVRLGPVGRATRVDRPVGATSLDLRGKHLAATWRYWPTTESCGADGGKAGPIPNDQLVRYSAATGLEVLLHGGCRRDGMTRFLWGARWSGEEELTFIELPRSGVLAIGRWRLLAEAISRATAGPDEFAISYADDGAGSTLTVLGSSTRSGGRLTSTPQSFGPEVHRSPSGTEAKADRRSTTAE